MSDDQTRCFGMRSKKQIWSLRGEPILLHKFVVRPLFALALICIIFFPAIPAAVNQSANSTSSLSLRDQILAKQSTLDRSKAIALAIGSNKFQALTHGSAFVFNSIFNTWSSSNATNGSVIVNWINVNVVYSLRNVNGSTTNVIVSEDPGLTKVLGVSLDSSLPQVAPLSITPTNNVIPTNNVSSSSPQSATLAPPLSAQVAQITGVPQPGVSQLFQPILTKATNSPSYTTPTTTSGASVTISPMTPTSPDFSISATVTQMSFTAGGAGSSIITLGSVNGFIGSIALVATITPNNGNVPSIPLNVSSITLLSGASGSAMLQVLTSSITVAQSYTISVTATSGTLIHSVSISLTLNSDVQVYSDPPSPSSFYDPGSSTATIHITSVGLAGTVTLTGSIAPSSSNPPSLSFNPGSISVQPGLSYTSTLTITTSASTPSGTYTITVSASGATLTRSTTVTITENPDFQISGGPALYLANGVSGTSSVNLNSLGLAGSISLSADSPSGISTTFSPNPVSLNPGSSGSSQATVSVPSSLSDGTFTITVTGQGPNSSHTTTLTVNVCQRDTATSTFGAGYNFGLDCSGGTTVNRATATWGVPSVSEPSSFFCYNQDCDATVSSVLWDGTTNSADAVFAGSFSHQHCGLAGCDSPVYSLYYDYAPNAAVKCLSVSSGDSTTNEVYFDGSSYTASMWDNTSHSGCSTGQGSSMGTPVYASFVLEKWNTRLPKFSQVTISGCALGNTGIHEGCSDSDYNGYSHQVTMANGSTTNASVGTISSNSFTITWKDSSGT